MAQFNADFWEVPVGSAYLEGLPREKALWFETETDRERRYALEAFYKRVLPSVQELINAKLTRRQRQVLELYFFEGKTQEDIAEILELSQSTVSRHLFGTVRDGHKVGGAIPKLQKLVSTGRLRPVDDALDSLQHEFARSA